MRNATNATSIALGSLFAATAAIKLTGSQRSAQMREHLDVSAARWRQIGVLELAGATGAVVGIGAPRIGAASAAGLAIVSAGAIAAHRRAGDNVAAALPAAAALALSASNLILHQSPARQRDTRRPQSGQ